MEKEMTRLEGAKELLKDLQESFLDGLALKIEANDFNLVSWLIEQYEANQKKFKQERIGVTRAMLFESWVEELGYDKAILLSCNYSVKKVMEMTKEEAESEVEAISD